MYLRTKYTKCFKFEPIMHQGSRRVSLVTFHESFVLKSKYFVFRSKPGLSSLESHEFCAKVCHLSTFHLSSVMCHLPCVKIINLISLCRIRTERNGGAWCPKAQIMKNVYEYLEIDLGRVKVITVVETQGRFGNGQVSVKVVY